MEFATLNYPCIIRKVMELWAHPVKAAEQVNQDTSSWEQFYHSCGGSIDFVLMCKYAQLIAIVSHVKDLDYSNDS